jgi:hypothetical protein
LRLGDLPWPNTLGGPPLMIGAWANGIWIKRAARDYDGWLASGGRSTVKDLREGIKRFRAEGGKRAIVATVSVDLSKPSVPLTDESSFTLRCSPDEALARLKLVEDFGYDDILLRGEGMTDADVTAFAQLIGLPRRPA